VVSLCVSRLIWITVLALQKAETNANNEPIVATVAAPATV